MSVENKTEKAMNEMISSDKSMDEEEVLRDFDAEAELIIQTEKLPMIIKAPCQVQKKLIRSYISKT